MPPLGEYAVGNVFFSPEQSKREKREQKFMEVVAEEGQIFLGWRDVPVDHNSCGKLARDVEPTIRQAFIARGKDTPLDMFE